MGYTHYWYRTYAEPRDAYGRLAVDAQRIIDVAALAFDIHLNDWRGEPFEPGCGPVTEGEIRFNGVRGHSCETFCWPAIAERTDWTFNPERSFNCTKTRMQPYGAVLCAILLRALQYYDDLEVTSDGDIDDPQWQLAAEIYRATFDTDVTWPDSLAGIEIS
jgi:hypothetical protein